MLGVNLPAHHTRPLPGNSGPLSSSPLGIPPPRQPDAPNQPQRPLGSNVTAKCLESPSEQPLHFKNVLPKCPSLMNGGTKCGIFTVECHSVLKRKEMLTRDMTWINLDDIMLS